MGKKVEKKKLTNKVKKKGYEAEKKVEAFFDDAPGKLEKPLYEAKKKVEAFFDHAPGKLKKPMSWAEEEQKPATKEGCIDENCILQPNEVTLEEEEPEELLAISESRESFDVEKSVWAQNNKRTNNVEGSSEDEIALLTKQLIQKDQENEAWKGEDGQEHTSARDFAKKL